MTSDWTVAQLTRIEDDGIKSTTLILNAYVVPELLVSLDDERQSHRTPLTAITTTGQSLHWERSSGQIRCEKCEVFMSRGSVPPLDLRSFYVGFKSHPFRFN